ncbi:MAG: cytochrome c family protein [Hyphomicrobiales bacterium]|nr:cytochrome c family protein [Hyphomicrobiales bacterium]MCY4033094.1 cytochrome c family protein [Hyphomicrobiales bacterium]MCY4039151.1 cytochrome c family protein [Hyphomicrobiales bacterium]
MNWRIFDYLSRPRAFVAMAVFLLLVGLAAVLPEDLLAQDGTQETAENAVSGDAMRGEKVFRKCKACHTVEKDGRSRIGPNLWGIVDNAAGAVEGFKYSKALIERAEAGLVWDVESLDAYLRKPREFLKGGKMTFGGLRKEQDRLDVITYMREEGAKE